MNTDLSFVPTDDLVQEITKRTTFAGIIICSEQQHCKQDQIHNKFKIYSSLDKENAKKLLEIISTNIIEE